MAKKKSPKKRPSGCLPTGATKSPSHPPKSPSSSPKSLTPDSASAAKLKSKPDSRLAGTRAQENQTPSHAQEDPKSTLAKQIEVKASETLVAGTPLPPGFEADTPAPVATKVAAAGSDTQTPSAANLWKGFVKEAAETLDPKETPYLLDSGEACVTIPNVVVEKNKKAWEYFILGQFYEEAPARGAVHAIVNGIWSRQRRDITVNKMEGNSFLFRVPCPNARRRILNQSLW